MTYSHSTPVLFTAVYQRCKHESAQLTRALLDAAARDSMAPLRLAIVDDLVGR
jgi:hypothetical protein